MPWMSIIVWVLSFILSGGLESGKAGKAALIATGAAVGTWFAVDPANPNAYFDIFKMPPGDQETGLGDGSIPGIDTSLPPQLPGTAVTGGGGLGGIFDGIDWPSVAVGVGGAGLLGKVPWWVLLGAGYLILK